MTTRELGRTYVDLEMHLRAGRGQAQQMEHMRRFAEQTRENLEAVEQAGDEFHKRLAEFYRGILSRCD